MNATVRVNGTDETLRDGSLHALLQRHGVRQARGCAVAVNGSVVPATDWPATRLTPGDDVEILRIVGGG